MEEKKSVASDKSGFSSEPPSSTIFQGENKQITQFQIQPVISLGQRLETMSKTQDFKFIRPKGVEVDPSVEDKRKRKRVEVSKKSANEPNSQSDTAATPVMGTPTPATNHLQPKMATIRFKKMSVDERLISDSTHRSVLPKIMSITPQNRQSPSGLHLVSIKPKDACNRLYDRHISIVHDKYNAQELHLKNLLETQVSINKLKKSKKKLPNMSPEFFFDEKQDRMRNTMYRNRHNSRTFHINEELGMIYKRNLQLQHKIDGIKKRQQSKNLQLPFGGAIKSPLAAVPNYSLNHFAKKKEVARIANENMKMASRIIGQSSSISRSTLFKEEERTNKIRQLIRKSSQISIKDQMEKQRQRIDNAYGHFSGMIPDFSQFLPENNIKIMQEAPSHNSSIKAPFRVKRSSAQIDYPIEEERTRNNSGRLRVNSSFFTVDDASSKNTLNANMMRIQGEMPPIKHKQSKRRNSRKLSPNLTWMLKRSESKESRSSIRSKKSKKKKHKKVNFKNFKNIRQIDPRGLNCNSSQEIVNPPSMLNQPSDNNFEPLDATNTFQFQKVI